MHETGESANATSTLKHEGDNSSRLPASSSFHSNGSANNSGFLGFFQQFSCCVSSRKAAYGSSYSSEYLGGTGARSRPRRKVRHHPGLKGATTAVLQHPGIIRPPAPKQTSIEEPTSSLPISSASSSVSLKSTPLLENWMEHFAEWKLIDIPIIPGTHHSGVNNPRKRTSMPVWGWARCQEIGIDEQLHFGVRFLDLRVRVIPTTGEVLISHGLTSDTSLIEALDVVKQYLSLHPTEVVLVYVRADKWHALERESVVLLSNVIASCSLPLAEVSTDWKKYLAEVCMKDIAGKVMIVSTADNVDKAIVPFLPMDALGYCDIWQSSSIEDAKARIIEYMETVPERDSDIFGGVAIDGTFPIKQQSQTSRELNQWFIDQLATNEKWIQRVQVHQFGIVMIDFADFDILNFLVGINHKIVSARHSS